MRAVLGLVEIPLEATPATVVLGTSEMVSVLMAALKFRVCWASLLWKLKLTALLGSWKRLLGSVPGGKKTFTPEALEMKQLDGIISTLLFTLRARGWVMSSRLKTLWGRVSNWPLTWFWLAIFVRSTVWMFPGDPWGTAVFGGDTKVDVSDWPCTCIGAICIAVVRGGCVMSTKWRPGGPWADVIIGTDGCVITEFTGIVMCMGIVMEMGEVIWDALVDTMANCWCAVVVMRLEVEGCLVVMTGADDRGGGGGRLLWSLLLLPSDRQDYNQKQTCTMSTSVEWPELLFEWGGGGCLWTVKNLITLQKCLKLVMERPDEMKIEGIFNIDHQISCFFSTWAFPEISRLKYSNYTITNLWLFSRL